MDHLEERSRLAEGLHEMEEDMWAWYDDDDGSEREWGTT